MRKLLALVVVVLLVAIILAIMKELLGVELIGGNAVAKRAYNVMYMVAGASVVGALRPFWSEEK